MIFSDFSVLYSRYWTGTSLKVRLMRGVFSNANDNTAAKRTAHEYKFKLPVSYAFPVMY